MYRMRSESTHIPQEFAGRAALITGASRGIGYAIAGAILDGGGSVCLTARRADELHAAVAALGGAPRVIGVAGASEDPQHRADAVATTIEHFGSLDILVNNAATNPLHGPLLDADKEALGRIFTVNVFAPVLWVRSAWEERMAEHGGAVLNVASTCAVAFEPNLAAYAASKAALIHITRQLAVELSPGVRVNAIAPAVVKTRFARVLYADAEDALAATYPLGRLGVPDDVAPAARFLLGEDASWITGQTLVLDGGLTAASGALDRVDRVAARLRAERPQG